MAGADMLIDAGTVTNSLSAISAGRDLSIDAGTLNNTGLDLYETTEVFRHFFSMGRHDEWEGSHTQTWSSSNIYKSMPAVLTAGRALTVNVREGYDNSGRENAEYAGLYSGSPAYQGLAITGIGLNNPATVGSDLVDRQNPAGTGHNPGDLVPGISQGGLFSLRTRIHNRLSKVWACDILTIVSADEVEIS